jgi:hypothetical protein
MNLQQSLSSLKEELAKADQTLRKKTKQLTACLSTAVSL